MSKSSSFLYFNVAYILGLFCFSILYFLEIEILFLTNFIIIVSIILFTYKLLFWLFLRKTKIGKSDSERIKIYLLRLAFCIFTYVTPVYCLIQEPNLIVSHKILVITFTIVSFLAIIGVIIERKLFILEAID
tara:strand:- start:497 stop:892 length:396 start_codon:yes stop_codon:yes gene_type:complete